MAITCIQSLHCITLCKYMYTIFSSSKYYYDYSTHQDAKDDHGAVDVMIQDDHKNTCIYFGQERVYHVYMVL